MGKWKWIALTFSFVLVIGALAGFALLKFMDVEHEPSVEESAEVQEEPPKTATEILAAELAGDPAAFPKATAEDISRPPAQTRESISLDEEFESLSDTGEPEGNVETKKRSIASVPKKTSTLFKVESAKTVISKNLDRKKALAQLRKDFSRDDCKADTGKAKSLKAEVSLKKDGTISKIKMKPSTSGDKDLIRCLKKKMTAKAKAYKSKSKTGGKLTLQLKLK